MRNVVSGGRGEKRGGRRKKERQREIEREGEKTEQRAWVVGRAGDRRDTPRRTGNEGRNVVARRYALVCRRPASARSVEPRRDAPRRDVRYQGRRTRCGAIGVTCGVGARGFTRGVDAPRALQFPIRAPRSPAFRSTALRCIDY